MKRYNQQIILPEIGALGQKKINVGAVLIIGAGGLGTVVATYLGAMGVGNVGIVDFDKVDESNLHRQFLFCQEDIGKEKSDILAFKIEKQNPNIVVKSFNIELIKDNIEEVISKYSIVCDCTDNLKTRLLIDKKCQQYKIPLVHGAVSDWQGYVTIFHYKNNFEYQDLFNIKALLQADSCVSNGINSSICGIIGSMMSNEAIKIILGSETNLDGGLLHVNGLNNNFKILKLKKHAVH